MQKIINTIGSRLLCSEKLLVGLTFGWCLEIRMVSIDRQYSDKNGWLCLNSLNTCFSSGSLEFWCALGRRCLCHQAPIKTLGALNENLGTESLMNLPDRQLFTLDVNSWGNKLNSSCVTPLGEACAWLPPDFTPCAFSLGWLYFVVSHGNQS